LDLPEFRRGGNSVDLQYYAVAQSRSSGMDSKKLFSIN
jgi:hypothetical protein